MRRQIENQILDVYGVRSTIKRNVNQCVTTVTWTIWNEDMSPMVRLQWNKECKGISKNTNRYYWLRKESKGFL